MCMFRGRIGQEEVVCRVPKFDGRPFTCQVGVNAASTGQDPDKGTVISTSKESYQGFVVDCPIVPNQGLEICI